MNWDIVKDIGGIGIAFGLLFYGFKFFEMLIAQWRNSNDTVNKNTDAFLQLSVVFERAHQRELEFQEESLALLKANNKLAVDTNAKVKEIHEKVI
jgi:hypothetical protein